MNPTDKGLSFRILMLITSPKLAHKATDMFHDGMIPMHYKLNAVGTASNEMMDILGLGSIDKNILIGMMPKYFADEMLRKLNRALRLGSPGSGIAFTLPLSGANNLLFKMVKHLDNDSPKPPIRKEGMNMSDIKYCLIAAVINQGYSEDVMEAARTVGATGGTVVHSRRVCDAQSMCFWGLSIQDEKEIVLIVTDIENKIKIMHAIGEKCGMHSDAKGIILSLPIDSVVGPADCEY